MRADAQRRRDSIVREARRLFAFHGQDVALEAVAAAAGVGIATLYRNFESRTALADAVTLAILDDIQAATQQALDALGQSAERAWRDYVHRLVELDLGALSAALSGLVDHGPAEPIGRAQIAALAGVEQLLDALQQAGLVRADLAAVELVLGVGLLTRPQSEAIRSAVPRLQERLVRVLLDGMRGPSGRAEPIGAPNPG